MLPAAARLRTGSDFSSVLRNKRSGKAGGSLLVVHVASGAPPITADTRHTARVGFVVSKAVGNAVVRNRTKRVLRHHIAAQLPEIPAQYDVVVRAQPAAGAAAAAALTQELDRLLHRALSVARKRS